MKKAIRTSNEHLNFESNSDAEIIQSLIEARKSLGLTQKELSERTGIAQGDISKLETGNTNPSLHTLVRLAEGMGMYLKVEFCSES